MEQLTLEQVAAQAEADRLANAERLAQLDGEASEVEAAMREATRVAERDAVIAELGRDATLVSSAGIRNGMSADEIYDRLTAVALARG